MHAHPDLLRFIENRLTPTDRQRVEAHLAACAECRADWAETLEIVDRLEAVPAALGAMPLRTERLWRAVWSRAERRPMPAWPMTLGMSVLTICLVLSSALPLGAAYSPLATRDDAHAPRPVLVQTPVVSPPGQARHTGAVAAETQLFSTTAPKPAQTPIPGPAS